MNARNAGIGCALLLATCLSAQQKPEVPKVDAGAGACWVDFSVSYDHKPVYNAKVHAQVRYGVFHKTDVEVGTNYEGKARISGLPEKVRKPPLTFEVSRGNQFTAITHDPATNCHASYEVVLPDVSVNTPK